MYDSVAEIEANDCIESVGLRGTSAANSELIELMKRRYIEHCRGSSASDQQPYKRVRKGRRI